MFLGPPPVSPVLPVDDVEILREFLVGAAAVAALVGDRVGTALVGILPEIRLARSGGTSPVGDPVLLDSPLFQIDCYGQTSHQARLVARTVAAVLRHAPGHPLAAGVVQSVTVFAARDLTAVEQTPRVPRWMLDVRMTIHPHR